MKSTTGFTTLSRSIFIKSSFLHSAQKNSRATESYETASFLLWFLQRISVAGVYCKTSMISQLRLASEGDSVHLRLVLPHPIGHLNSWLFSNDFSVQQVLQTVLRQQGRRTGLCLSMWYFSWHRRHLVKIAMGSEDSCYLNGSISFKNDQRVLNKFYLYYNLQIG